MTEEVFHILQDSTTADLIRFHICGTTFPDKNYHVSRADAKTYCIEYVAEGNGVVQVNDETFFIQTGDSYLLHAHTDQNYYTDRDSPWKKYFINVSGKLIDALVECFDLTGRVYFKGLNLEKELKCIIEIAKLNDPS